jgi:hypothetical protein
MAWSALIPVIAALAGGMFGRSSSGSSSSGSMSPSVLDPQMMELLNEQRMRQRLQNPLFEETTQLMRSLMPKGARPTSYVLPSNITSSPEPLPNTDPTPQDPNPPASMPSSWQGASGMSGAQGTPDIARAIQMLSGGLSPFTKAQLFRR